MSARDDIAESELIDRYQSSGDQQWLSQLFVPYMELLYGVALKYLKQKSDAEDLVMDVYELVGRKLKTHEVKDFRPWLYVVAKNCCFDRLRKASSRQKKENTAHDMYSETIFHPDNVKKENQLNKLEDCVEKLNKEQKTCVTAFYYQSMTYEQIAEHYSLSWNTVRSSIQNGRRKLKICMDSKKTTN